MKNSFSYFFYHHVAKEKQQRPRSKVKKKHLLIIIRHFGHKGYDNLQYCHIKDVPYFFTCS